MNRNLRIIIVSIFIMISLCSCNRNEDIHIYSRSGFATDATNITIDKKYTLKDYSKEYLDDECVVIIRYEKIK